MKIILSVKKMLCLLLLCLAKISYTFFLVDTIGLHSVENPSNTDGAVSLHLYCPPFDSCSIFDKTTGKQTKCKVTFWSKYGEKTRVN